MEGGGNFQVSFTFLSNLSTWCLPEFAIHHHHFWPPAPKLNDDPARQEQTDAWIVINVRFEIMSQSSQTEPNNLELSEILA